MEVEIGIQWLNKNKRNMFIQKFKMYTGSICHADYTDVWILDGTKTMAVAFPFDKNRCWISCFYH